jgi:hypothetical protein
MRQRLVADAYCAMALSVAQVEGFAFGGVKLP